MSQNGHKKALPPTLCSLYKPSMTQLSGLTHHVAGKDMIFARAHNKLAKGISHKGCSKS
jgi:hypothetical protein